MKDNIEELLNKDSVTATLQEIAEDVKDWDSFGSIAIVYSTKAIVKYRYFGSNAEVIGLLEMGKQSFLDRILYNDNEVEED